MKIAQLGSLRQYALNQAAQGSPQAASETTHDQASLSETALKQKLIADMIRISPGLEESEKMVEALSYLPAEALQRISDYGTKIEVFDKQAERLPLYARKLTKSNLAGAYSPTANVIFVDKDNITPRILVHESMHALDSALGGPSQQKPWTVARDVARQKLQFIRPYASHNSAEYFADNLAASLFSKDQIVKILSIDLQEKNGTEGLTKEHLVKDHLSYNREDQKKADPIAGALVERFWEVLPKYPVAETRPALSPQQYRQELLKLRQRRQR